MKEKIISIITLASIFSLFLYYKVNSEENVVVTGNNQIIEEQEYTIKIKNESNIENDLLGSNKSINYTISDDCVLSTEDTNLLSFSDAFKYYRMCLGNDQVFTWNTNNYKTVFATELVENIDNKSDEEMIVQKNNNADKEHLDLQNQMFGENPNK